MAAILFTRDLLFGSQFTSAAKAQGIATAMLASASDLAQHLSNEAGNLLAIDLSTPGLELPTLISAARAANQTCFILAYDSHVREDSLATARSAGCDLVLSRGQFSAQMSRLIQEHGA